MPLWIDHLHERATSRARRARHGLGLVNHQRAAVDHRQDSAPPRKSLRTVSRSNHSPRHCGAPGHCTRLACRSLESDGIDAQRARPNPRAQRAQRSAPAWTVCKAWRSGGSIGNAFVNGFLKHHILSLPAACRETCCARHEHGGHAERKLRNLHAMRTDRYGRAVVGRRILG